MRRDHVTRFRFPVNQKRSIYQERLNMPPGNCTITRIQVAEFPKGVTGWRVLSQPYNMSDILPPSIMDITPIFCDEGGGFIVELWSETDQELTGTMDILFTLANAR